MTRTRNIPASYSTSPLDPSAWGEVWSLSGALTCGTNNDEWPLYVSLNEYRSLAAWLGKPTPGPVRRGALFYDPPSAHLLCRGGKLQPDLSTLARSE